MIDLLEDPSRGKEILNCHTEINSNNILRLFEEKRRKFIGTRDFVISNTEKSFMN
jgi:hypothetical protein